MDELKRTVMFHPAFDKRSPNPKENYGIHGVEIRFLLSGPHGAVQFLLFTNWQLPHVAKEFETASYRFNKPMPADLGYHSRTPHYEGHQHMGPCEFLDGANCYYDGSSLNAERVFNRLLRDGDAGVWSELEDYYRATFQTVAADEVPA